MFSSLLTQIYVGGPTIAKGYLKKPELTKSKFIQRPAEVSEKAGERLYRTGDWGYMLSSGELEICGRCDSMVKVRGYSIELQVSNTHAVVYLVNLFLTELLKWVQKSHQ